MQEDSRGIRSITVLLVYTTQYLSYAGKLLGNFLIQKAFLLKTPVYGSESSEFLELVYHIRALKDLLLLRIRVICYYSQNILLL